MVKIYNNKYSFSKIVFIFTIVFFYMPLVMLVVYSFNESKSFEWGGFSLKWYKKLFFDSPQLWGAFKNSLMIAILSSTFATIIGTLGAIGLNWYKFKTKKYIQTTSYLPLVLPDIVMGISLLVMFNLARFDLGFNTILIAHITFNIPYVLFIVLSRLEEFDYSIIEASYDLGAHELDTLLRVIIPVSLPGVISAFLISSTLSIDDFVVTFFVSGPGASTLPLHIYSMIKYGATNVINAISVVLILMTIVIAIFSSRFYKYALTRK